VSEPLFKHGAFPRQVIRSSLLKHKLLGYLILILESNWVLSVGIIRDHGFGKYHDLIHCHSQPCQIICVIAHHEMLSGKSFINSNWCDCNMLVFLRVYTILHVDITGNSGVYIQFNFVYKPLSNRHFNKYEWYVL